MVNPSGEIKYWFQGLPAEGGYISANDSGTIKYFFNGLSSEQIIPTTGAPPPGTNMQLNIGDVWKTVSALKINIGDVWKDVVSVKQNIGDVWKTVF